ncbi:MAG: hypothetical protein AMXMBFR4_25050 [Candidatus Hydrogenedentota bacterium]
MELVLSEFGARLGKSGERLVVKRQDKQPVEFPARDVRNILITGQGISVSSDAVRLAAEHGADLTFLSMSGEPFAKVIPIESFGKARLRRQQLLAATDSRGVALCQSFLRAKLKNQISNLRYFAKSRKESAGAICESLHVRADAITPLLIEIESWEGTDCESSRLPLMNREARAAQEYWAGVAAFLPESAAFPGRVRRGATDPVNICLNYGYGILYSRLWKVVLDAGLDPYAGFLHADQDNRPTLVFDFIEEFRQFAVDRPVFGMFTKRWVPGLEAGGSLTQEARAALAARILEQLVSRTQWQGRAVRLCDVMTAAAYEVVAVIEERGRHVPFVAEW